MPLPSCIQIDPPREMKACRISVPGSKSLTNRALILAALGSGRRRILGALWSEDTQVMTACLERLGIPVSVEPDPEEACNRILTVEGKGGTIPRGGSDEAPLSLYVGNAGTAARFLTAMVCLGEGVYRLHGTPRMHERPQAGLFAALRELGYRIEPERGNEKLPVRVHGGGPRHRRCRVGIAESSQFASALLLCENAGGWEVEIEGEGADHAAYISMTRRLREQFVIAGSPDFHIEPDASSGSYFWAMSWLNEGKPRSTGWHDQASIQVAHWPESDWQIDSRFPEFLPLPDRISRARDLGDSILTAMVLAPWAGHPVDFVDLARLRVQECDRVQALYEGLQRCDASVTLSDKGERLTVFPSSESLKPAEVETYDDHRVAMCFAVLGFQVPGMRIRNPTCVKKTFPDFFQKLVMLPPKGLGAIVRDASRGRVGKDALEPAELFAE